MRSTRYTQGPGLTAHMARGRVSKGESSAGPLVKAQAVAAPARRTIPYADAANSIEAAAQTRVHWAQPRPEGVPVVARYLNGVPPPERVTRDMMNPAGKKTLQRPTPKAVQPKPVPPNPTTTKTTTMAVMLRNFKRAKDAATSGTASEEEIETLITTVQTHHSDLLEAKSKLAKGVQCPKEVTQAITESTSVLHALFEALGQFS